MNTMMILSLIAISSASEAAVAKQEQVLADPVVDVKVAVLPVVDLEVEIAKRELAEADLQIVANKVKRSEEFAKYSAMICDNYEKCMDGIIRDYFDREISDLKYYMLRCAELRNDAIKELREFYER